MPRKKYTKRVGICCSLIYFILLISFSIALPDENPALSQPPDINYAQDYTSGHELDWLDNAANWNDPNFFSRAQTYPGFFDRPEFLPQAENFLDNPLKVSFSASDSKIATEYVHRITFSGNEKAKNIGEKFFSASGDNVKNNVPKAQEFFQAKWGPEFKLAATSIDFSYKDGILNNNDKSIALEQYRGLQKVESVADGFCLTFSSGQNSCFGGDGQGFVDYESESEIFVVTDSAGKSHQFRPIETAFSAALETAGTAGTAGAAGTMSSASFNLMKNSKVIIKGSAQGKVAIGGEIVRYNNHEGTLQFNPDGNFKSHNAEIITKTLYVDGAAEKKGNIISANDHGYTTKGNVRDRNTIVMHRPTGVGMVTLGQTEEERAVFHVDDVAAWSRFSYKPSSEDFSVSPVEEGVQQSTEQLRAAAKQLQPPQPSIGKKAEVWVKQEGGNIIVNAKGRVEVSFYGKEAPPRETPLRSMPSFTGNSGVGELDLRMDGSVLEADVRGNAIYEDKHQRITNSKDQALVGLRRDESVPSKSDLILVECPSCRGEAVSIEKSIVIGKKVEGTNLLSFEETRTARIIVSAAPDGTLSYLFPEKEWGALIAPLGAENKAVLEKGMLLEMPCTAAERCQLQVAVDRQGSLGAYFEHKSAEGNIKKTALSGSIKMSFGKEEIIVSSKNMEQVQRLLELRQDRNFKQLSEEKFSFEEDPALRQYLLRETGIDVNLLGNEKYTEKIAKVASEYDEYRQLQEKLKSEHGLVLDEDGRCVGEKCGTILSRKIGQAETAGYVYTAAKIKLARAQEVMAEALHAAGALSDSEKKAVRREADSVIKQMEELQDSMDVSVQRKRDEASQRERSQRISKEVLPTGKEYHDDVRRVETKSEEKKLALQDLDVLKQERERAEQILRENSAIAAVADEGGDEFRSPSSYSRAQRQMQAARKVQEMQDRLAELRQEEQVLQKDLAEMDLQVDETILKYADENPHIGVSLAIKGGKMDLARGLADEVSKVDFNQGVGLSALADVWDGNLLDASKKVRQISSDRQDVISTVNDAIYSQILSEAEKEYAQAGERSREKYQEMAGTYDSLFEVAMQPFTLLGRHATAVNIVTLLPGEQMTYAEARQQLDQVGYTALTSEEKGRAMFLSIMSQYREQGVSPDEALHRIAQLTPEEAAALAAGKVPAGREYEEGVHLTRLTDSAGFNNLQKQLQGEALSEEEHALVERQEIERQIISQRGLKGQSGEKLRILAARFPDTEAGRWAKNQVKELETRRGIFTEETYTGSFAEAGVEAFSVADVIPGAAVAKVGTTAAKAVSAFGKIEKVSGLMPAEKVVAVLDKIKEVGEPLAIVLTKERYISPQGQKLAQRVEESTSALEQAQRAGDAAEIARQQEKLADTRTALDGWKAGPRGEEVAHRIISERQNLPLARSSEEYSAAAGKIQEGEKFLAALKVRKEVKTGFLTRERGWSPEQSIVYEDLRTAAKNFDVAVETRGALGAGTEARALTEAAENAENFKFFTKLSPTAQTASKIEEELGLQSAGGRAAEQLPGGLPEVTPALARTKVLEPPKVKELPVEQIPTPQWVRLEAELKKLPELERPRVSIICHSPCEVRLVKSTGEVFLTGNIPPDLQLAVRDIEGALNDLRAGGRKIQTPDLEGVGDDILFGRPLEPKVEKATGVPEDLSSLETKIGEMARAVGEREAIASELKTIDLREGRIYTSQEVSGLEGKIIHLEGGKTTSLGSKLGEGSFGVVYCYDPECSQIIKIPIFDPAHALITPRESLLQLQSEISRASILEKKGIRTAKILNPDSDAKYLLKEFVDGPTISKILKSPGGKLTEVQIDSLADIYRKSILTGTPLDAHPGNLIWDEASKQFILIDNGFGTDTLLQATWKERFFDQELAGWERFNQKSADIHNFKKFSRYEVAGKKYVYLPGENGGWFQVKKKWGGLLGTEYEPLETIAQDLPFEDLVSLESMRLGISLHAETGLPVNALGSLDGLVNGKIVELLNDDPELVRKIVSADIIEGLREAGYLPETAVSEISKAAEVGGSVKTVRVVSRQPATASETVVGTTPRASLENLLEISSSPQQINSLEARRRTETLSRTMRSAEDMSIEDIRSLSQQYRERLVQSGVRDETPVETLEDLVGYRTELLKEDGFLDFVADIDRRFPPDTQKVMLGTDGIEYTSYTYHLLTNQPDAIVIPHYISRKTLATREEYSAIVEEALLTGKEGWELTRKIERLQSIGTGKIRLYEDMNNVILEAHRSQLTGGPRFEHALSNIFHEKVMSLPQNRQRIIELIAELQRNADVQKPLVLVDVAGRAHVQSFTLKYGAEWLGKAENWASLNREQQILLGDDLTFFREADIQFHLGIGRSGVTEHNPLAGMDLDGVYMVRQDRDIVEKYRSIAVDDNSIIQGEPLFIPTDAYEQANTFQRRLAIADAINDWKLIHEPAPVAVVGQ